MVISSSIIIIVFCRGKPSIPKPVAIKRLMSIVEGCIGPAEWDFIKSLHHREGGREKERPLQQRERNTPNNSEVPPRPCHRNKLYFYLKATCGNVSARNSIMWFEEERRKKVSERGRRTQRKGRRKSTKGNEKWEREAERQRPRGR